ncbi:MAG: methyltransferase domain-containing protein [Verrucomicrobiales bacterium]|nr:MAG: methyltransferase domain-containing protein [Verrucomicrobiaceae bacterium]
MVRLILVFQLLFSGVAISASPIHEVPFRTIEGKLTSLSELKDGPVLIVNVASECGYTGQYAGLQILHERYAERGLNIVAFPCNDFGGQEPGSEEEIKEFCKKKFNVTFPMASKIKVKGDASHPLYKMLTEEKSNPAFFGHLKWNFEKFLIDRDGQVVNRFRTRVRPTSDELTAAIEWALMDKKTQREQYDKVGPPALLEYCERQIARTMHWQGAPWLMRKVREEEERTSEMVKELKLKPGMSVADIGSGNGYHTLMMAEIIGNKGTAYAVDIQPEMLQMLEKRANKAGMKNIKSIENRYWDTDLPESSIDFALMADVYHEFSHPEQMLSSIRRALKPQGIVSLLEFREEDPKVPIKPEHKMSKEQVIKEMTKNGFKLSRSYDKLPWQHLLFFQVDTEADLKGLDKSG